MPFQKAICAAIHGTDTSPLVRAILRSLEWPVPSALVEPVPITVRATFERAVPSAFCWAICGTQLSAKRFAINCTVSSAIWTPDSAPFGRSEQCAQRSPNQCPNGQTIKSAFLCTVCDTLFRTDEYTDGNTHHCAYCRSHVKAE